MVLGAEINLTNAKKNFKWVVLVFNLTKKGSIP